MHIELFISRDGTIQDQDGDAIGNFGTEQAAADFAVRFCQDAGAPTYTLHFGKVA